MVRHRQGLLIALALLLAACAGRSGPSTFPLATPTASTPAISSDAEPVWRTQVGGALSWRPQLAYGRDGRARLIAAPDGGPVVALDPATGDRLWEFRPPERLWSDSVTVLGDAVLVGSAGAVVTLLDVADGAVRWQRSLQPAGSDPLPGLEARSQAVLADGVVYVPTAGIGTGARQINPDLRAPLVALDFATGAERWRFVSGGYLLRAPFVGPQGQLYVGATTLSFDDIDEGGALKIYALNTADGRPRWVYESADGLLKSLWADGDVLAFIAYRDFIVGLNVADGTERYRHNTGNWVQSFAVLPALRAPSGAPALAYGSANAFLNLIDPADGTFIWRYNIEGTFNYPIGNAVMAGRIVYFISQRGDLHALDAATGTLRWRRATGLETRDGLAVGEGLLFVGSADGYVYGFRLRVGDESTAGVWR